MSALPSSSSRRSTRLVKSRHSQPGLGESAFADDALGKYSSHGLSILVDSTQDNITPTLSARSWLNPLRKSTNTSSLDTLVGNVEDRQSRPNRSCTSLQSPNMFYRDRQATAASTSDPLPPTGSSASIALSSQTSPQMGTPQVAETIDIEAAINLLQELKKKATPEELVALHRALLPTKEVPTESPLGEYYDREHSTRRRSNLLPGLATRGGAGGDLLRRPGEVQGKSPQEISPSVYSPDQREPPAGAGPFDQRSLTAASNDHFSVGAYLQGTLHITNGAASPASSVHGGRSEHIEAFEDQASRIAASHALLQEQMKTYSAIQEQMRGSVISTSGAQQETPAEAARSPLLNSKEYISSDNDAQQRSASIEKLQNIMSAPLEAAGPETAAMDYSEFAGGPFKDSTDLRTPAALHVEERPEQSTCVHSPARLAILRIDIIQDQPSQLRPAKPLHSDSGYGSESSTDPHSAVSSKSPGASFAILPSSNEPIQQAATAAEPSVYTSEEMVAARSASRGAAAQPQRPARSLSRHRSLFQALKLGRGKGDVQKPESSHSDEKPSCSTDVNVSAKAPVKQKSKKLKKVAPHYVKQARKELKRMEDAAQLQQTKEKISFTPDNSRLATAVDTKDVSQRSFPTEGSSMKWRPNDEEQGAAADVSASSSFEGFDFGESVRTAQQYDNTGDYSEQSRPWRGMDDATASRNARQKSRDYSDAMKELQALESQQSSSLHRVTSVPDDQKAAEEDIQDSAFSNPFAQRGSPARVRSDVKELVAAVRRQELEELGDEQSTVPLTSWDLQAKIWRERRQSVGKALQRAADQSNNASLTTDLRPLSAGHASAPIKPLSSRPFQPQRLSMVKERASHVSPMSAHFDQH